MLVWLKKVEHYELKNIKIFESINQNEKNYKIWSYWNPKANISTA